MALRLSLVIDGNASGAKKALEETGQGLDKLDKSSAGAAKSSAAVAGELANVDRSAKAAAGGIVATGNAAGAAASQFTALRGAAIGALAGFASGAVLGVITTGLQAAAAGAVAFFGEILSSAPRIERDLTAHGDLVERIAGAYRRAKGAASDYGVESRRVLAFELQQNIAALSSDLRGQMVALSGHPLIVPTAGDFVGPLRQDVESFFRDLRAGTADFTAFRDRLASVATTLADDSPLRDWAQKLLDATADAAALQGELKRALDLSKGMIGDARALGRAIGGGPAGGSLSDLAGPRGVVFAGGGAASDLTRAASGSFGSARLTTIGAMPFAPTAAGGFVAGGGGGELRQEFAALSGAVVDFTRSLISGKGFLDSLSGAALTLSDRLLNTALTSFGDYVSNGLGSVLGNLAGGMGGPIDLRPPIAQASPVPAGVTNYNFHVETPSPRAFAESRSVVTRAASRVLSRVGRVT